MYAKVDPAEKPYVLNAWANAILSRGAEGANQQGLTLYQEALRLKPDYFVARYNIMQVLCSLGDEEGVVAVGEGLLKSAGGGPGAATRTSISIGTSSSGTCRRCAPGSSPIWNHTAVLEVSRARMAQRV